MSNFDFLKDYDETLWKLGNRIEKQVNTSPSGVKADATTFLEHILKRLLAMAGLKYNSRKKFSDQVDAVFRSDLKMSNAYRERIKNAYRYRNKIHDELDDIEKHEFEDAVQLHEKLFYIARKFYRDYNDNYDRYKGVPEFKPLELDFSDSEVELVKIPDFNEIVDISYDYCVICGKPNHSNYSIYCHRCGRVIDNANHFISIRNTFGKDAEFTKEDLMELHIPEGYINQLLHSLVVEDMLRVSGRFYTFNNLHFDDYLVKIEQYLAVGELITKFREDKISPSEIKETLEYRQGKTKHELFYQFYKITNREIIKKFEKDLLVTENIWKSIDYTTITQEQLKRWYEINLGNYQRGTSNESFVVFNQLLIGEYLELKSEGILEAEIRKSLNVSSEVYEFWCGFDEDFEAKLKQIKIDLITEGINDRKTREEIIEYAGVTPKEYMDLIKVSEFKGDELSQIRNQELESRKADLIEYLKHNDLETSCRMAKVSVDDFYQWYDDMASQFYEDSSRVLMHNFLNERRKGRTKAEAAEIIGLEYEHIDRWFKRTLDICEDFQNSHVKVIADLIYAGFKDGKSKAEISELADVRVERIDNYLSLGKKGYGTFKQLYDYYESEILPKELSRFLDEIKSKPLKKALEVSELTEGEFAYCCSEGLNGNPKYKKFYEDYYNVKLNVFLNKISKGKSKSKALRNAGLTKQELRECYELGRQGDERFEEFYQTYYNKKLDIYTESIMKDPSHSKALKNADLSEDELPEDIDEMIFDKRLDIVTRAIKQDLTTKQAARKANVTMNDIYGWFMKGRSGDDRFEEFSEIYYENYVSPGSRLVQMGINEDVPLNFIFKRCKGLFTREDYDFWLENGFLKEAQEELEKENDDEESEPSIFKK